MVVVRVVLDYLFLFFLFFLFFLLFLLADCCSLVVGILYINKIYNNIFLILFFFLSMFVELNKYLFCLFQEINAVINELDPHCKTIHCAK